MAFDRAGCAVEAVCPRGHLIAHVKSVIRRYQYSGFLHSIRSAIQESKPDFIIPCDDYATLSLHTLHSESGGASGMAQLLERSLGNSDGYAPIMARSSLLTSAGAMGICVPPTEIVADKKSLVAWLSTHGFPAYLKADGTSGGVGVRMVETLEQAEAVFDKLSSPPGMLRMLKRTIIDKDMRLIVPWLRGAHPVMSVQPVIRGPEANCAVACWQGRVLACISVQVVERSEDLGPATVVRPIDNAQIFAAAEKIAKKFGLTGLYGLDFILEEETGTAYLLEINARSTQTSHLPLGPCRNPVAALVDAISGRPQDSQQPASIANHDLIALFPQEWKREPDSEYLMSAYHDVPWGEPDLVRECVKTRLQDRLSYRKWTAR
jgi:formate-dependent phosphoribosylglycinamide formyltransferase (GAR transformylase)